MTDIAGAIIFTAWVAFVVAVQVSAVRQLRRIGTARRWSRHKIWIVVVADLLSGHIYLGMVLLRERWRNWRST